MRLLWPVGIELWWGFGCVGARRVRVPIEKFFVEYLADWKMRLGIGSEKSPSKGGWGPSWYFRSR